MLTKRKKEVMLEFVVVAIGGIVDHNYLNVLFIIAIIALIFPISNSNVACYVRFVNKTIL